MNPTGVSNIKDFITVKWFMEIDPDVDPAQLPGTPLFVNITSDLRKIHKDYEDHGYNVFSTAETIDNSEEGTKEPYQPQFEQNSNLSSVMADKLTKGHLNSFWTRGDEERTYQLLERGEAHLRLRNSVDQNDEVLLEQLGVITDPGVLETLYGMRSSNMDNQDITSWEHGVNAPREVAQQLEEANLMKSNTYFEGEGINTRRELTEYANDLLEATLSREVLEPIENDVAERYSSTSGIDGSVEVLYDSSREILEEGGVKTEMIE